MARAITTADISSRSIELELTEGALIEYSSTVSRAVSALREIGCSIALDDFGTGYSSLFYLRRFPIDTLKIDRTFVRDITVEHGAHAPLVDALLAMARSLSLNTVAEGVESDLQLQYLRSRGATQVQGFLFSRPLPLEELLAEHDSWTGASTATLKVAGDPR